MYLPSQPFHHPSSQLRQLTQKPVDVTLARNWVEVNTRALTGQALLPFLSLYS